MVNKITNEYNPKYISHPGKTLEDVLEEKGMTQTDLATRSGRPKKTINEIINGKAAITIETAIQFEKVLGVPASFWNNRQCIYDAYVAERAEKDKLKTHINWLKKFPVNDMINLKWINGYSDKVLQLNELLKYFGVNSPDEWGIIWSRPQAIYRQSPSYNTNLESISVWLRKGEIEAQRINCRKFNKHAFIALLKKVVPFTKESPEIFEEKVVQRCADSGVAVVFIPPLKGVPVFGVTQWVTPEKALIQFTLRGKYEDFFWFSFFHEAGHIVLHGKRDIFIESADNKNRKEEEADNFAKNLLIPQKKWNEFITPNRNISKDEIIDFATRLDISPAIIVGRLQYEKLIPYSYMNDLRRKYKITDKPPYFVPLRELVHEA